MDISFLIRVGSVACVDYRQEGGSAHQEDEQRSVWIVACCGNLAMVMQTSPRQASA